MVTNSAAWVRDAWDKGYKTGNDKLDDVMIGVDGDTIVIARIGYNETLRFSREDWRKLTQIVAGELKKKPQE